MTSNLKELTLSNYEIHLIIQLTRLEKVDLESRLNLLKKIHNPCNTNNENLTYNLSQRLDGLTHINMLCWQVLNDNKQENNNNNDNST